MSRDSLFPRLAAVAMQEMRRACAPEPHDRHTGGDQTAEQFTEYLRAARSRVVR